MKHPNIQFDPAFMEEAVFLSVYARGENGEWTKSFHRERESLYSAQTSPEEREEAFRAFFQDYFFRAGFDQIFEKVLSEFPKLRTPHIAVYVKKVLLKKEEGSDLYVQGNLKTVLIGLQSRRVLDRNGLGVFLRHELMHVADMLDPDFHYDPHADLGGTHETEDQLIRERFRLLWNIYVDSRIRRNGFKMVVSQEKQYLDTSTAPNPAINGGVTAPLSIPSTSARDGERKSNHNPERSRRVDFEQIFKFLSKEERNKIYRDITQGECLTQAHLIEWARDPRLRQPLGTGGPR